MKTTKKRAVSFFTAIILVLSLCLYLPETGLNANAYDVGAAFNYADKYWCNYNPNYASYKGKGGDCANFVSQCLHAGGLPMDNEWNPNTSAWKGCISQMRYLTETLGFSYIINPNASEVHVGDPIYYDDGNGDGWDHVTLCVGFDDDGTPLEAGHTTDEWGNRWDAGYYPIWGTVQITGGSNHIDSRINTEVDNRYPKNIFYESPTKIYTYDVNGRLEGNRWTDPGDPCTIVEAYASGFCKIIYPASGVDREAYALISDCWGYEPTPSNQTPIGCVDEISGREGKIHIRGWAFDPDDSSRSITVHVYIVGSCGDPNAQGVNIGAASVSRPDVNVVYGLSGNHGFDIIIDTSKKGEQPVYVYAINYPDGDNPLFGSGTANIKADTEKPVISNIRITDVSNTGYTITCTVTDEGSGLNRVQFPTWTIKNSQDDIQSNWVNNSKASGMINGKTITYRVNTSDHNHEHGTYRTHIYAYDEAGNCRSCAVNDVNIPHNYIENGIYASCTTDGKITYTCSCGDTYTETIKATGHKVTAVAAKAATCTADGNTEHWHCDTCGKTFSNETCTTEITQESTIIHATGHKVKKYSAKAATCTANGRKGYYYCSSCKYFFSDKACAKEISKASTVIKATGHKATAVAAKAATCTADGNTEHWHCDTCGKTFSNETCTTEITQESTIIHATGHKVKKYSAKAATCTANGRKGYYYCSSCKYFFSDKACAKEISKASTVIKATGHHFDEWYITLAPTLTCNGTIEHECCDCHTKETKTVGLVILD